MIQADSVLSTPRADSPMNHHVPQTGGAGRPMFPPREQNNVVQFSAARPSAKRGAKINTNPLAAMVASAGDDDASLSEKTPREIRREARQLMPPATETCRNTRLRRSRRDAWWDARQLTDYWRARLEWNSALSIAQQYNIADANSYPKCDHARDRWSLLDLWREALVKQMLTPAPDVAAVGWKRAQLRAENYRFTDVKPERIQRAIDDDLEWLAAHPTRKSIAAARQAQEPQP